MRPIFKSFESHQFCSDEMNKKCIHLCDIVIPRSRLAFWLQIDFQCHYRKPIPLNGSFDS